MIQRPIPVRFHLTAGHMGDAPQALTLIEGLAASRATKHPLDADLYAQRQHFECCINKLKQFRRVATRYEKTAGNFLAVVTIAAFVLWLR